MIIRNLDSNGDWTFGQGKQNYLTGQAAVELNVQTRLLSFVNNCIWAMNFGIDWINLLSAKNSTVPIQLNVKSIILKSFGILRINSISVNYNRSNRSLSLQYNADSIFTSAFRQELDEELPSA